MRTPPRKHLLGCGFLQRTHLLIFCVLFYPVSLTSPSTMCNLISQMETNLCSLIRNPRCWLISACMREEKGFANENAEWTVGIHFHKNTFVPRKNKIPDPDRIGIFGVWQKNQKSTIFTFWWGIHWSWVQSRLFHNEVDISESWQPSSALSNSLLRDRRNLQNVEQLHQSNCILPLASDRYTWFSVHVKTVVDSGENQFENGHSRILYAWSTGKIRES